MSNHFSDYLNNKDYRHLLGISGGKDSSALAIYIKNQYPEIHNKMEYFFSDTGAELNEVYDYLDKLEAFLGKEIIRLNSGRSFDDWLVLQNEYLPSPRQRWCTQLMKIKPFEEHIGEDAIISYVGIRADENRSAYVSRKETVKAVFPFVEDGLIKEEIKRILADSIGMPEYYKWRSRSGCYFCFFQRQDEWLGLKKNHPELYEKARQYEQKAMQGQRKKYDWDKNEDVGVGGEGYTWSEKKTLDEIVEIAEKGYKKKGEKILIKWQERLQQDDDEDEDDQACTICSL